MAIGKKTKRIIEAEGIAHVSATFNNTTITITDTHGNTISTRLCSAKLWAFAHLIANGTLAAAVLFGSFLVWAVVDFASSRRRDRSLGIVYAPGSLWTRRIGHRDRSGGLGAVCVLAARRA